MKGLKEIANDNARETQTESVFNKPFPNLRTREIVKNIVSGIVETNAQCKATPEAQERFALGFIRGALTATAQEDDTTRFYIASLLDVLNKGGLTAINALVEAVTGEPLTAAAA